MATERDFWAWIDSYPPMTNACWTLAAPSEWIAVMDKLLAEGVVKRHRAKGCKRKHCMAARSITTEHPWHYGLTPEQRMLRALKRAP